MDDPEQARPRTADDIRVEEKTPDASEKSQVREGPDKRDEAFLMAFGPDDSENPKNWTMRLKWGVTGALSATSFNRIMVSTVSLTGFARSEQCSSSYNCLSERVKCVLTKLTDNGTCNQHHRSRP
jgi:hypothetical protein